MLLSSVSNGLMNRELAIMETLTCIKRAGADLIITYFAEEAVSNIKKGLR
jgi:porphobilinogen synthase